MITLIINMLMAKLWQTVWQKARFAIAFATEKAWQNYGKSMPLCRGRDCVLSSFVSLSMPTRSGLLRRLSSAFRFAQIKTGRGNCRYDRY